MKLILKTTTLSDLDTLFLFQADERANQMAAFTPENYQDRVAYLSKWTSIVENPAIKMQTIYHNDEIIGSVIHFELMGETNVSYIVDPEWWGKGVATQALQLFINSTEVRPLYGRVAFDNYGSQRVLEKCGFQRTGQATEFANARQQEIVEFIYRLEE